MQLFINVRTQTIEVHQGLGGLAMRVGSRVYQPATISFHHARIVAKNLKAGKPYYCASPVYEMTRQELALFHTHVDQILTVTNPPR